MKVTDSKPFLDDKELISLTNRVRRPSQIKVLNAMGIVHQVRPDGSIVVLRAHINKLFGGDTEEARTTKVAEPDWAAI